MGGAARALGQVCHAGALLSNSMLFSSTLHECSMIDLAWCVWQWRAGNNGKHVGNPAGGGVTLVCSPKVLQPFCVSVIQEHLPCTAHVQCINITVGVCRLPQALGTELHVISDDEAEWQPDWRSSDSEGVHFLPCTPAAHSSYLHHQTFGECLEVNVAVLNIFRQMSVTSRCVSSR